MIHLSINKWGIFLKKEQLFKGFTLVSVFALISFIASKFIKLTLIFVLIWCVFPDISVNICLWWYLFSLKNTIDKHTTNACLSFLCKRMLLPLNGEIHHSLIIWVCVCYQDYYYLVILWKKKQDVNRLEINKYGNYIVRRRIVL